MGVEVAVIHNIAKGNVHGLAGVIEKAAVLAGARV
jgi:hypothetical protein